MGRQKVILSAQNVFHRIFIGHYFAIGEIFQNVAIQCRRQCGFPGAGFSADEACAGFSEHGIQQIRFNIHSEDVGISDGITRMVTEMAFSSVADVPCIRWQRRRTR